MQGGCCTLHQEPHLQICCASRRSCSTEQFWLPSSSDSSQLRMNTPNSSCLQGEKLCSSQVHIRSAWQRSPRATQEGKPAGAAGERVSSEAAGSHVEHSQSTSAGAAGELVRQPGGTQTVVPAAGMAAVCRLGDRCRQHEQDEQQPCWQEAQHQCAGSKPWHKQAGRL